MKKLSFKEIEPILNKNINKPFCEIFSKKELNNAVENKGKSGTLLEKTLGLVSNASYLPDLIDMEIKTQSKNESIAISMISSHINNIMSNVSFVESWIYKKIKRMLFVKIDKNHIKEYWKYIYYKVIDLDEDADLFKRLEYEFNNIKRQMIYLISKGEKLKTINGDYITGLKSNAYLQIRTKDNKPYHPIRYNNIIISDKNYAFYFRNFFVREIIETSI